MGSSLKESCMSQVISPVSPRTPAAPPAQSCFRDCSIPRQQSNCPRWGCGWRRSHAPHSPTWRGRSAGMLSAVCRVGIPSDMGCPRGAQLLHKPKPCSQSPLCPHHPVTHPQVMPPHVETPARVRQGPWWLGERFQPTGEWRCHLAQILLHEEPWAQDPRRCPGSCHLPMQSRGDAQQPRSAVLEPAGRTTRCSPQRGEVRAGL